MLLHVAKSIPPRSKRFNERFAPKVNWFKPIMLVNMTDEIRD